MQRPLSFVLLLGACAPSPQALGTESSPGSGSGEGTGTGQATGSTTSPGGDSMGSGDGSTGPASTGTSIGTSTDASTTEEPVLPGSCAEILAADPTAPSGLHAIARPSDGVKIEVHCEMKLDGGGWTLVGRSEPGNPPIPFGWGQSAGIVGDPDAAYSLDVVDVGLPFTEILITGRDDYAIPVGNAYVIEVPEDFVADHGDHALEHMSTRTVLGDCEPTSSPTMLAWVGHTESAEYFFLRDNNGLGEYGLTPRSFRLAYDDCTRGADLDGEQGALFVR